MSNFLDHVFHSHVSLSLFTIFVPRVCTNKPESLSNIMIPGFSVLLFFQSYRLKCIQVDRRVQICVYNFRFNFFSTVISDKLRRICHPI